MAKVRVILTAVREYEIIPGKGEYAYLGEDAIVEDYLDGDVTLFDPEQGGDPMLLLDSAEIEVRGEVFNGNEKDQDRVLGG
jgi:hypothetical protein